MTKTRNRPTELGRKLGKELARLCDGQEEKYAGTGLAVPHRCATCAFRAGTYANGCEATLMDAVKCTIEQDTFLCHEHRKDDKPPVCAGFVLMRNNGDPIQVPWDYVGGE